MAKRPPKTDAQICREKGWDVGAVLQWKGVRIQITRIGENSVAAKVVWENGAPIADPKEYIWGISGRKWAKRTDV